MTRTCTVNECSRKASLATGKWCGLHPLGQDRDDPYNWAGSDVSTNRDAIAGIVWSIALPGVVFGIPWLVVTFR